MVAALGTTLCVLLIFNCMHPKILAKGREVACYRKKNAVWFSCFPTSHRHTHTLSLSLAALLLLTLTFAVVAVRSFMRPVSLVHGVGRRVRLLLWTVVSVVEIKHITYVTEESRWWKLSHQIIFTLIQKAARLMLHNHNSTIPLHKYLYARDADS